MFETIPNAQPRGVIMKAPRPHWLTVALSLPAVVGTAVGVYVAFFKTSGDNDRVQVAQAVVGHEIQNSGPGVGQVITNGGGGTGGEVNVSVPPGTSAVGTRIIQNGPGTGLMVIQNGPGVGFRSTVTVGPSK
jgi:hypothetical protein